MKILKKALLSLSIILLNSTKVYATTAGTYVPETESGAGKFFLFIVAIGLIALVLFIGYKMDKNEAQEKRKEKIIKQRDNDINDMYSNIYSSFGNKEKEIEKEETEILPEVNFAPETEEYFKDLANDSTQKIEVVDSEEINAYSSLKPEINVTENTEETIYEEVEEDGYTEEEDVYESEDFGETQVISIDEEDDEDEGFDSTVVFDTGPLKNIDVNMNVEEKIINKISDVKGYDYEDNDTDLLDLEQTIAEANIKKYTRDKNQEMIKVKRVYNKKAKEEPKKENKDEKKYTRKKLDKKESKKKEEVKEKKEASKRYKAKKTTTKKEDKKVEKKTESKTKKYTKVTSKKEDSKDETPKRGRKATVKEEKTKKERKTSAKIENDEKPKRGRKPSTKK